MARYFILRNSETLEVIGAHYEVQPSNSLPYSPNNYVKPCFNVYPNPAKQVLNLDTKTSINVTSINIYNSLGQMIIVIPNAESVSTIDVSDLKTGTYFIKVNTDKGTANTKFIKK